PPVELPKAGEPVLLVGGHVLTTDGLVFKVAWNRIADAPHGALALPSAPRNPHATLTQSIRLAGPEDKTVAGRYATASKTYDACRLKIESPVVDQLAAFGPEDDQTPAQKRKVAAIQAQVRAKEEATCKPKALDKLADTTHVALIKTRTARRAKLLAAT